MKTQHGSATGKFGTEMKGNVQKWCGSIASGLAGMVRRFLETAWKAIDGLKEMIHDKDSTNLTHEPFYKGYFCDEAAFRGFKT
ncbi:MAG: hypothetical protein KGS48_07935 [Bacteroidetes bacterium]|nr:hypothetical protein [Bacteroidota bacterium]